ncbi:unnamed protein product [Durusdinium trenchii]|uniref:Uncharacterized protein n=2 Tax=Durusdinium trenchii TaxID=1381693 RepID=A0ABP0MFQ9_9DINO
MKIEKVGERHNHPMKLLVSINFKCQASFAISQEPAAASSPLFVFLLPVASTHKYGDNGKDVSGLGTLRIQLRLKINLFGTMRLTDRLLPLLRATAAQSSSPPRVVNVASMAGRLRQLSPALQSEFASETLDRPRLLRLVFSFVSAVQSGRHREMGWSDSNYGLSKLALIAYTRLLAREEPQLQVNACCPGYCCTDMSSNRGGQDPAVGARTVLAAERSGRSGEFFENERISEW